MTASEWDGRVGEMASAHDGQWWEGIRAELRGVGIEAVGRHQDWQRHRSETPASGSWEVEYLKSRDLYVLIAKDEPRPAQVLGVFLRRPDAMLAATALWQQAVIRRVVEAFGRLTPAEAAALPTGLGAPFIDIEDARRCLRASEGK